MREGQSKVFTYVYNQKVQPTPVVGEIFLEAVCDPFEEHLQDKDVREDFVSIFQNHLYNFSPLYVNIFKCLERKQTEKETGLQLAEHKYICLNKFQLMLVASAGHVVYRADSFSQCCRLHCGV